MQPRCSLNLAWWNAGQVPFKLAQLSLLVEISQLLDPRQRLLSSPQPRLLLLQLWLEGSHHQPHCTSESQ